MAKNNEFKKKYALIREGVLLEILSHYLALGEGGKNFLRVAAGRLEEIFLHQSSKVDLYRIINCRANKDGIRRLSEGVIKSHLGTVNQIIESNTEGRSKPVSRSVLQVMAQGQLSASEICVMLFYFTRRIDQTRELKKLKKGERYGRFTYGELREACGLTEARASEAVSKLRRKGLLHTVPVKQQNINRYGQLFVDGWLISLCRTMRECVGKVVNKAKEVGRVVGDTVKGALNKTASPTEQNRKPPLEKTARLKKEDPKSSFIIEKDSFVDEKETLSEMLERLKRKCELQKAAYIPDTV